MQREVILADALQWLPINGGLGPIFTSLPDAAEFTPEPSGADYERWLENAVCVTLRAARDLAVFFQTDRKADGGIISKAGVILRVAQQEGWRVHWHKVVLIQQPGTEGLRRPAYSHLIAVGRVKGRQLHAPDVILKSDKLHRNGMPIAAAEVALSYVKLFSDIVIDPFVGWGTTLAVAERLGFAKALGVDIDPECVDKAKNLLAHVSG
jgi:hypothetical protein